MQLLNRNLIVKSPPDHLGGQGKGRLKLLLILCACIVIVGSFARFVSLDHKIFFCDEFNTSLEIAGQGCAPDLFNGPHRVSQISRYQQLQPAKELRDTLRDIRYNEPFMPPLYDVLGRFWAQRFGADITSLRMFSACISLLEIPCMYFLCLELFGSMSIALPILALYMVSPVGLQLAQYARPYSLWTVLTMLSSALLLRGLRRGDRRTWITYSLSIALSLYCHISALRVLFGHALHVALNNRNYKNGIARPVAPFVAATVFALVLFIPWAIQIINHLPPGFRSAEWFAQHLPILEQVGGTFDLFAKVFCDCRHLAPSLQNLFAPLVVLAEVASAVCLVRTAPRPAVFFLGTLFVATLISLALPDIIYGGNLSTMDRYMMPTFLSIQCAVGYAVACALQSKRAAVARSGWLVFVGLIALGIFSCSSVLNARTFWGYAAVDELKTARFLNQFSHPVLLGSQQPEGFTGVLLSIASASNPGTVLAFSPGNDLAPVPAGYDDQIFVWKPTGEQVELLRADRRFDLQHIEQLPCLWRLVPSRVRTGANTASQR